MAKDRSSLQALLEQILGSDHVYFQPPPSIKMEFPCIRYERDDQSVQHADNVPYNIAQGYQLTFIAREPDSDVVSKLSALPLCSYDRHYATSELNHDVFTIYH